MGVVREWGMNWTVPSKKQAQNGLISQIIELFSTCFLSVFAPIIFGNKLFFNQFFCQNKLKQAPKEVKISKNRLLLGANSLKYGFKMDSF